jgi:hypothetical protein
VSVTFGAARYDRLEISDFTESGRIRGRADAGVHSNVPYLLAGPEILIVQQESEGRNFVPAIGRSGRDYIDIF